MNLFRLTCLSNTVKPKITMVALPDIRVILTGLEDKEYANGGLHCSVCFHNINHLESLTFLVCLHGDKINDAFLCTAYMHVAYRFGELTCLQFLVGYSNKKIRASADSFFCGMTTSNVAGLDAITWACMLLLSYPTINSSEVVCTCVLVRLHVCNGYEMTCEDMIVCLSCHCYFCFSRLHTLYRHTCTHWSSGS